MRQSLEIEASHRIVLQCGCGERLVLLGREDDWSAEGRDAFECGCGEKLTLADRLESVPGGADLLRDPTFLDGR
jgi:hypothetical protein